MIILSHPTGNFNVRMTSKALYEFGLLEEFHTCISFPKNNPFIDFLGGNIKDEYFRRVFTEIPESKQVSHPKREFLRQVCFRSGLIRDMKETHPMSDFSLYKNFDQQVSRILKKNNYAKAVYCYEDGAKQTFIEAKKKGKQCIYELPIGYWKTARKIFEEETEINPEWANTLPGLKDSANKLRRKDDELELADSIVVASKFVETTLRNDFLANKNIYVIPYCTPSNKILNKPKYNKGKLRVLFVGSLTQRKGLSYALDAINALNDRFTLTIIGQKVTQDCEPLNKALEKHTWFSSLPHNQILQQMQNHDVLLFPTLFDGFGLVITEALSQGIPVITTINSGGPECIRHGIDGFIVPIRDTSSIISHLDELDNDREKLQYMKESCIQRSKSLSFDLYKNQLSAFLNNIIK